MWIVFRNWIKPKLNSNKVLPKLSNKDASGPRYTKTVGFSYSTFANILNKVNQPYLVFYMMVVFMFSTFAQNRFFLGTLLNSFSEMFLKLSSKIFRTARIFDNTSKKLPAAYSQQIFPAKFHNRFLAEFHNRFLLTVPMQNATTAIFF